MSVEPVNWTEVARDLDQGLNAFDTAEVLSLSDEERAAHPFGQMFDSIQKEVRRARAKRAVEMATLEPQPFIVSTEADILNRPSPAWLIQDLIQENTICVLAAPGGLGKTFLAIAMSRALACGSPFFGKQTKQGKTLYVAAEGVSAFGDRVRAWNAQHDHTLTVPADAIGYVEQGVNLKDEQSVMTLSTMVREGDYSLVVLDTFSQLSYIENENSNSETAEVYRAIKSIRDAREGTSVLVLHHTPATGGKARGATAHRDNSDTMIMAIPVGNEGEQGFTLSTRNEDGGKQKDGVAIQWHGFSLAPVLNSAIVVNNGGKRPLSPNWEKCLPLLEEGEAGTTALRKACGIEGDMRSAEGKRFKYELDHWEEDGLVTKGGGKTNPTYTLSDAFKGVTS